MTFMIEYYNKDFRILYTVTYYFYDNMHDIHDYHLKLMYTQSKLYLLYYLLAVDL